MTREYFGIEIQDDRDVNFTTYARDMLMEFYSVPGEKSIQELFARASVRWSTYHGVTDYEMAQFLYDAVSQKWFMFASPVLSNAPGLDGKIRGMPISCFLGYVPDTVEGLVDHSTELRWLSVMGGGVGGHWSDVRSISEKSPGPMPFIHTVDADMLAYKQGKTRKGSYAAYMSVDHPDILEFLSMRVPTGDTNRKSLNLHHAVNITDHFMGCVRDGIDFELVDPKTGPTGKRLNAREIWNKILEVRFRTGEPYVNFIDTANEALPESQKKLGLKIHGSNLCNEIHEATNENRTAVCCLSSPNAELYDEWKDTPLIGYLTRMLDNVIEYFIEKAPPSLSKAVFSATRERSIGIGCMGFHSYLQRHNIPFESEKARLLNEVIFSGIKRDFLEATHELARERGEAPDMVGTGRRNAHGLAIAPNASSGVIVGTSPSIEPFRACAYTHRTRAGSVLVKNAYLEQHLEDIGQNTPEVWNSIITTDGSVQHLGFLDQHTKDVFKTAFELDQFWIVMHAADRQKHICQGQSVNLFFRPGTERKYVREVHEAAYDMDLKGLYYLRSESVQRPENVSEKLEESKLTDNTENIVYGKKDCLFCVSACSLLDARKIEYEYVDIEELGKTAAEVTGRADVRTVPQIYLDGAYIGGFNQLLEHFKRPAESTECVACEG
jgi:ribonucleoside-diphosphate reductase alpha chain